MPTRERRTRLAQRERSRRSRELKKAARLQSYADGTAVPVTLSPQRVTGDKVYAPISQPTRSGRMPRCPTVCMAPTCACTLKKSASVVDDYQSTGVSSQPAAESFSGMDDDSCFVDFIEIVPIDDYGNCSESSDVEPSPCDVKAEPGDDTVGNIASDISNKSRDVFSGGMAAIRQATTEEAQPRSRLPGNTPFPFDCHQKVTSDSNEYECPDERTAFSSTLISDVNESEQGEDDALCDLLLRDLSGVNSRILSDAGDIVNVQHTDDAEMQNSWDRLTNSCSRLKHPSVQKTYDCSLCHRTFLTSSFLAVHKQTRTCRQPYVCRICKKAFLKSNPLALHLRTHEGYRAHEVYKPHKCNVCYMQFTQRCNLKKHMMTHTGEKPHKCDVCHEQFAQRIHLDRHMLRHTGEKPHKCDVCDQQFTKLGNLKRHMLTHTGDMPHKCYLCCKEFAHLWNLKRHLLKHTGERHHECDV